MLFPTLYHEDLFDDAFRRMAFPDHAKFFQGFGDQCMKTDVHEDEKGWQLDVDMPGLKKSDIRLSLKDGYMTIAAQKKEEKEENQKGACLRRERWTGSMSRSFYVGEDITEEDVKAKFEDGVLTIKLPKKQQIAAPIEKMIAIQ